MPRFHAMNRRLPRLASAAFLAILAVAVAVPYPALGCCASAAKESCCCKKVNEAAAGSTCCRKPVATESPAVKTQDQCSAGTCPCCQQAPPQNVPTDRTADRTPVDYGFVAPIVTRSLATTYDAVQPFDAPVKFLTAIPHRILHYNWLI